MKLVDALDVSGRVVLGVYSGRDAEELVIVFADETFLSLRSVRLDDETEIEVQSQFNPLGWQFPDLEEAFGKPAATAMHQTEIDRRSAARLGWVKERRERLGRELRALDEEL